MTKISIAELKRQVNSKRVKFIANSIGNHVPFDRISVILDTPREQPYSTITFNTVDMLRKLEDGEISHCCINGVEAFMSEKGFVIVAPWGKRVNVMVYQF